MMMILDGGDKVFKVVMIKDETERQLHTHSEGMNHKCIDYKLSERRSQATNLKQNVVRGL